VNSLILESLADAQASLIMKNTLVVPQRTVRLKETAIDRLCSNDIGTISLQQALWAKERRAACDQGPENVRVGSLMDRVRASQSCASVKIMLVPQIQHKSGVNLCKIQPLQCPALLLKAKPSASIACCMLLPLGLRYALKCAIRRATRSR